MRPALDGGVDLYLPIVDWGVRADAFDAPLILGLRFRSLDRATAQRTLRGGTDARASLNRLRAELADVTRDSLVRAAFLTVAGGLLSGALSGGVVGALTRRRRWLGYGAAAGAVIPAVVASVALFQVRSIDYSAFEHPTFYAHGRELPGLLSLSGELLTARESYTKSYEQALAAVRSSWAVTTSIARLPTLSRDPSSGSLPRF